MRSRWIVWIGVVLLLLIGILASMFQSRLYYSQSIENLYLCLAHAGENGAATDSCFQISLAANSAYSTATSANQLNLVLTYFGLMLLVGRIISIEKRIANQSEDPDV